MSVFFGVNALFQIFVNVRAHERKSEVTRKKAEYKYVAATNVLCTVGKAAFKK